MTFTIVANTADLTSFQKSALELIDRNGKVFAGKDEIGGRVVRTASSTLRSLERRGLVTIELLIGGGMTAKRAS